VTNLSVHLPNFVEGSRHRHRLSRRSVNYHRHSQHQ